MHYEHVCIESLGYAIPDETITSDEIERRLEPLYRRLRLPEGRLELMSGIRERRLWPRGNRAGQIGIDRLKRMQQVALLTAPEIRLIQAGNVTMVEKFNDILNTTLPAWKKQMSMTILALRQKENAELGNSSNDLTISNGAISVLPGMFPEMKTIEPYSPTARANASANPVSAAGRTAGKITRRNV